MSRGVPYDPVCTNQTTVKIAQPSVVKATAVPFDPVCRTITGTQTATPDLPSSG